MSTCKNCSKQISWFRTQSGKPIPLERAAEGRGNVTVLEDGTTRVCDVGSGKYTVHPVRCAVSREKPSDMEVVMRSNGERWEWELKRGDRVQARGRGDSWTDAFSSSANALSCAVRGQMTLGDW